MGVASNPSIVTSGLIGFYDAVATGSSANTWQDLSGNGNDITLANSPTMGSYNQQSIMHFEKDSSQYGSFSSNLFGGLSAITANFWVRFEEVQSSGTTPYYQLLIFEACCWIAQYAGKIGIDLSDGNWFDTNGGVITGAQVDDGGSNITTGKWYNPCFTWGGSTVNCYMNGEHQRSRTTTGVSTLQNNDSTKQLGNRGSTSTLFDGDLTIAQLYNKTLSAKEVRQNYNAFKGRFGL